MRLRRALIALLACAVFAGVFLSACQSSTISTQSDAPNGEIVIGSDSYPPFNYLDENGQPTGIDIEITTEAFKRMGYSVKYEYIAWEEKDNLLASGDIDCVAGSFSMTGREDLYKWAGPYMTSRQVVAVNPGSDIKTLADLEGKVVAVQTTTKPETILLNNLNKNAGTPKNVFSVADRSLMFPLLTKGYVDAIAPMRAPSCNMRKTTVLSTESWRKACLMWGWVTPSIKTITAALPSKWIRS